MPELHRGGRAPGHPAIDCQRTCSQARIPVRTSLVRSRHALGRSDPRRRGHAGFREIDSRNQRQGACSLFREAVLSGLPATLRGLVNSHLRVELELTVGVSESLRAQLDEGKLDLAFLKRL